MASTQSTGEKVPFQGQDISPERDKGLMKQIVCEGTNDDKPLFDDQVFIHYVGSELDGNVFINSRDRDEKFSFNIGKGEVIPAWDLGVATMKRGEIARFFCTPKYAYGTKGEKKNRSATNVIFEIELLDFNGKDLSDEKDGSIVKRILCRGTGRKSPNEDGTVQIQLKGIYEDKVFDERTIQFIVGLGFLQHVPFGVERAVCSMLLNEHCQLVLKAKALQGSEKFLIPTDKSVQYEVALVNFERMEDEQALSNREKLNQAELLKKRADDLVKNNYYELALKRYQAVVSLVSSARFRETDDEIKLRQLKIAAQSNLALCYLKLGDHRQCKTYCDNVLSLDAKNEKCLFRRGQVYLAFSNVEQAMKDFQAVLKINPSNAVAQQQFEQCQLEKNKKKETYKEFFSDSSKPGLFDVDEKYEKEKEKRQNENPLRSLGLVPIPLDSILSRKEKQTNK